MSSRYRCRRRRPLRPPRKGQGEREGRPEPDREVRRAGRAGAAVRWAAARAPVALVVVAFLFLSYPVNANICTPENASASATDKIKYVIGTEGHLSEARRIAYECLAFLHDVERYGFKSSATSGHCCPSSPERIIEAYKSAADALFRHEDYFGMVLRTQQHNDRIAPAAISPGCWDGRDSFATISVGVGFNSLNEIDYTNMSPGSAAIERWNHCCSHFRSRDKNPSCHESANKNNYLCCMVAEGLDNHLILPPLREPSVSIRLHFEDVSNRVEVSETINIEQEGSLRIFDVSGVLWPAGYLLGLCVSNPVSCGVPEIVGAVRNELNRGPVVAIELGAGVGFSSIAFAKAVRYYAKETTKNQDSPIIVATDISKSSFSLVTANAHNNGVGSLVVALAANHTDSKSLSLLSQQVAMLSGDGNDAEHGRGFSVIIGSSLQGLFDGTHRQGAVLWQSLDALLSKNNPDAVVLLSHVRTGDDRIELPPESQRLFECVRRVSGDHFAMKTRDGNSSDFELVLLRRLRPVL